MLPPDTEGVVGPRRSRLGDFAASPMLGYTPKARCLTMVAEDGLVGKGLCDPLGAELFPRRP